MIALSLGLVAFGIAGLAFWLWVFRMMDRLRGGYGGGGGGGGGG